MEYKGSGSLTDSTRYDWSILFEDTIGLSDLRNIAIADLDGDKKMDILFTALDLADMSDNAVIIIESDTPSAVKNSPAAPGSYALAQNYPNPLQISSLNPVTTIEFELTKPGHVLVTLYDINGHEVSKLIDREMADSIRWPVAASRHLFLSTQNRRFQRHKKDDPG